MHSVSLKHEVVLLLNMQFELQHGPWLGLDNLKQSSNLIINEKEKIDNFDSLHYM